MARYPKDTTPKLTRKLIEEICDAIRKGCYIETAVAYCGISKNTFYRWLREAKSPDASILHQELSHAIERAWAESEARDLDVIDKAALGTADKLAMDEDGNVVLDSEGRPVVIEYGLPPNWKASAWRLERKFPRRWGRQSNIEVTSDSSSIEIVFVDPKDVSELNET